MTDLDIQQPETKTEAKFSKSYLVSGFLGLLIIGLLIGGYLGFRQLPEPREVGVGVVEGETNVVQNNIPTSTETIVGQDTQIPTEEVKLNAPEPVKPKPNPAPKVAEQKPKVNVCQISGEERTASEQKAQTTYDQEIAEAGKVLAAVTAKVDAELSVLQKQRNEAINNYLTSIAIATSKYNSSNAPEAYEVYQQEQARALSIYTEGIGNISGQEVEAKKRKTAASDAYKISESEAKLRFDAALAAAAAQYQAKTSGQNCS